MGLCPSPAEQPLGEIVDPWSFRLRKTRLPCGNAFPKPWNAMQAISLPREALCDCSRRPSIFACDPIAGTKTPSFIYFSVPRQFSLPPPKPDLPLPIVQKQVGHKTLKATSVYLKPSDEAVAEAYEAASEGPLGNAT